MIEFPINDEFAALVKRIVWFEEPVQALRIPNRFLVYAMTYATFEDMQEIRRFASDDDLRNALLHAPPGIFDPRSWAYWHLKLGVYPPADLPTREFN